jgi:hypothetical protein
MRSEDLAYIALFAALTAALGLAVVAVSVRRAYPLIERAHA